jgi:hypothetical protein
MMMMMMKVISELLVVLRFQHLQIIPPFNYFPITKVCTRIFFISNYLTGFRIAAGRDDREGGGGCFPRR